MKTSIYISLFLTFLLASCGQTENQPTETAEAHDHASNENEVHLVQQQMDVMDIQLGHFQHLNLSTTVKSNGQLQLPPQNKASLSAVMGGRVKTITAIEGDHVSKGQVLATLEHPDFIALQEQYMASLGQLSFREMDYQRKKSLFADSLSSAKDLQQSEAEYQSLQASVNGLRARLQMLDLDINAIERGDFATVIPIKAPINGYVRSIEVNIGKYVHPDQNLFEIVDNDHIHIDLRVYEKDMPKIHEGQKVFFSLSNNPDSVFQGSIFALGRAFEDEPKAMLVHAEIDNKAGVLLPGMYVDARIVTSNEKVLALPTDAIVSDGGLSYIFVLKPEASHGHDHAHEHAHSHDQAPSKSDEHIFQKVEVNTGANDIGFVEVVPAEKISDHAKIVTNGAFYLLAEMKKGEGGHGHHH
ncbi:MAG: efflux RND transporter periplasmic adaptor subunit [Flavobacteriales bacterium]